MWVIDLEIALVKAFQWSLRDIDETDIESLLPFVMRYGKAGGMAATGQMKKQVYADQVSWL